MLLAFILDNDLISMFEEALKKQPTNEELGGQCFFANIRGGNWKGAQLVSSLSPILVSD